MTARPEPVFRASALQRAASPEELDHLVAITKPADWILAAIVTIALAAALVRGIYGRTPSRVSGQGILVGSGRVTAGADDPVAQNRLEGAAAAEKRLAALQLQWTWL